MINGHSVAGNFISTSAVEQQEAPRKPPTNAELKDNIMITIVPPADPSWTRIETLVRD